jgi:hypothetical protein
MTDLSHDHSGLGHHDDVSPLFAFIAMGGFWLMLGVVGWLFLNNI